MDLKRKEETHEIEERKNDHIFELMEKHSRAFRCDHARCGLS